MERINSTIFGPMGEVRQIKSIAGLILILVSMNFHLDDNNYDMKSTLVHWASGAKMTGQLCRRKS